MAVARPVLIRATIAVYCLCFAGGAFNHARDFARDFPRPYRGAPIVVEMFWSGLLFADLLVVGCFLTGRRRSALSLAAGIMVADVAINGMIVAGWTGPGFPGALLMQTAFLGFVVGSIGFLWPRRTPRGAADPAPDGAPA